VTVNKPPLHWSRWILIGTIAFMGVALLLTVYITYRGVQGASDALVRGQAATLTANLRDEMRDIAMPPSDEDLEDIVESYGDDGLHYIALVRNKQMQAKGGHSLLSPEQVVRRSSKKRRKKLVVRADRVQMILRRPGPRARRQRKQAGRRNQVAIFIEFEPSEALALQASSTRSLATGAGAAVLLWLTALFLLRWFYRQDKERARLEEDRRLASLGQMSAVLAHEIRNPLASLKGNAQILEKMVAKEGARDADAQGGSKDKVASKAQRVVKEALRLEELVNDLLDFARRGEIKREPVDPRELLRRCVKSTNGTGVEIDVESAPSQWRLDPARMDQVLSNLLLNAGHASKRVEARVFGQGTALIFVIRDHGDGILEESAATLFEPFHTKKTRGTGLGLAVAKRLVELHGGTISAKNAEGGGAEFRVEIPAG
jgi:two-component system sensor histidine kinase HydH